MSDKDVEWTKLPTYARFMAIMLQSGVLMFGFR